MASFLCNSVQKKRKYYHYRIGIAGGDNEICGTRKGKVKISEVQTPEPTGEVCEDGRPIFRITFN